ncbi:MAG: cytochrome c3 family protein [bacterium]
MMKKKIEVQKVHADIHKPFQEGKCLSCHEPHASDYKAELLFSECDLCYSCHKDKKIEFSKVNTHTPVVNGNCTGCHNPHLSNNKQLLREEPVKGCLTCHKAMLTILGEDNLHPPFKEGNCLTCHNKHTGEYRNLVKNPGIEGCLSCHKEYSEKLSKFKFNHLTLSKTSCIACHNPHGGKLPHQISRPLKSLCLSCHTSVASKIKKAENEEKDQTHELQKKKAEEVKNNDEVGMINDDFKNNKKNEPVVHQPVKEGECLTCHDAHFSDIPGLLTASGTSMCLDCHQKQKQDLLKIHNNIPIDKSNCLNCHDPHLSEDKGLLRTNAHQPFAEKSCLKCHTLATGIK